MTEKQLPLTLLSNGKSATPYANGQARHRTDDCHDDQLRDRRGRSAPQSNRTERDQSARGSRQPREWSSSMERGSNRDTGNRPDRRSYSYRSTSRSHDRHRRDSDHDWPHDSGDNNDRDYEDDSDDNHRRRRGRRRRRSRRRGNPSSDDDGDGSDSDRRWDSDDSLMADDI